MLAPKKASNHFQRLSAVCERGQSQVGPMALVMSCKDTNLFRHQMYLRKARRTKLHGTDWVQSCDTVKSGKSALSRIFLSPQEMQEAASSSSIQGSIQGRCKSQSRVSMQRLLLCIRIRDHAGQVHQGSLPWAKAKATDLPRSEDKRFQSDTLRPPRERKGSRMGATRAQSGSRTSRTFRKSQPLFKTFLHVLNGDCTAWPARTLEQEFLDHC